MKTRASLSLAALAAAFTVIAPTVAPSVASAQELAPYLQCVPYAREVSGIEIYGDAHTWWGQAEGRYERGRTPRVGAIMYFPRTSRMRYGHVAAVSRILDSRRVLLDHANWSPINGQRGQIERDVLAVDVSSANDWSEVRVWYAPLEDVGATAWPVAGFIYSSAESRPPRTVIAAVEQPGATPQRAQSLPEFTAAFSAMGQPDRIVRQSQPALLAIHSSTRKPSATPAVAQALSRYSD